MKLGRILIDYMGVLTLFAFAVCLALPSAAQVSSNQVIDFALNDSDGRRHQLSDYGDSKLVVVAFVGIECPLVKLYVDRLSEIGEEYDGVAVLGIDSNQQDSVAEIQHFVRTRKPRFPILKDPGNRIADQFDAQRTPQVFLLNERREIVYQGTIDDQYTYGIQKPAAKNSYLRNAIVSALADDKIQVPVTESVGCIIGRRRPVQSDADVTYCNEISRIFQRHCVVCHREGEIAPFSLTEYEEAAGWAEMIQEVVSEQRMPPWHADAEPGYFKNDLRLSDASKQLIYDWVAAGAPQGKPADLPSAKAFVAGWQIGEPDLVIAMGEEKFEVPARGVVPYQYFLVDPGFEEDKWVKSAECRPGNRAVVHHIIVGIQGEGEFGEGGVHNDLESEWISATAPGSPPTVMPEGYAKFIPAGSKLIFQMHYTPNGTAQSDLSHIGLIFADPEKVTHRVSTLMSYQDEFRIPAGAANHRVVSKYKLDEDVELLSMFPHMHYRGKSFQYDFLFPDGGEETLLSVPRYDFNWQNIYALAKPRLLPAGTRLTCTAHFDNSEDNLANPDPEKNVTWGDQTWEEMMIGYFNVAVPVVE